MPTRIVQIFGGILLGIVITVAWFTLSGIPSPVAPPAQTDVTGGSLPQPFAVPPLVGVNAAGDSVSTADAVDLTTAVVFGYTSCPDVCPLTLARVGRYRAELPPGIRDRLRLLFVSLDPERDTPERLARYVAAFPGGAHAMTGEEIRAQVEGWGVRAEDGPRLDDGNYLVDHTARVFILNARSEVVATLPPLPTPERIATLLDRVLAGRAASSIPSQR
ncbi:MAG: SCO family protein [Longimicrobiales bacterium]|nr:SCO family protein [Longimicrobiales bacterium]